MDRRNRKKFTHIINYKFNKIQKFLLIYLTLFFLIALTYTLFIFDIGNRLISMCLFLIFEIILLFSEILTFIYEPLNHFTLTSVFNWVDFLVTIGLLILVIADWSVNNNKFMMYFHFFGIFFISFRFLFELRIFSPFRHLTAMIIKVYFDIIIFLTFFIGYLIIYGLLDGVNQVLYIPEKENRNSFLVSVREGFDIAFGNWDFENGIIFLYDWILFVFTIITIAIIMLNVIIAIVSGTYEEYELNKFDKDLEEKLDFINDYDKMLYMFKIKIL